MLIRGGGGSTEAAERFVVTTDIATRVSITDFLGITRYLPEALYLIFVMVTKAHYSRNGVRGTSRRAYAAGCFNVELRATVSEFSNKVSQNKHIVAAIFLCVALQ